MYRETERRRVLSKQEINFICKNFRRYFYQLHIYSEILLQLPLLQEWECQYKKVDKKTVVEKLRKTRLTMTNHNLHKSN